ncbi:hypothetical protein ATO8_06806 [Roseivivax marinus]|uniref:SseB protein N-terminal domain-containing protein n=1 Tax=Roseivivax marinus TaxID=1379903 RepID=W4HNY2_9RHOB|nr:SseB family protein [Roseivivax marinus]ETW13720.1 hypothetical protein ATO8_06806 [Roseivivax marinus]
MTDQTPLDAAHAAMEAAPEDDNARLTFYARLADSELCVMLRAEAQGDTLDPETVEADGATFVLAFDREDRLSAFAGKPAPYAALPGRALAQMLAGQGAGLALNLDAPSQTLLPPEALGWLAETLGHAPAEAEARPVEITAPGNLPEALLRALDARLAKAAGLARRAYLAGVEYEDGARGHLLGLTGTVDGAEGPLARAVNEALVFSGLEAGALDVAFLGDDDPLAARLARVAMRFDLPEPPETERAAPKAPGSDPDAPPRLR